MTVNNFDDSTQRGPEDDGTAPKRKRMRVGDIKKQSYSIGGDNPDNDKNPYRDSNSDYKQPSNRYSDSSNRDGGDYNRGGYRQSNYGDRNDRSDRGEYNRNDRSFDRGGSYDRGERSYDRNDRGNDRNFDRGERSYNRGGGYDRGERSGERSYNSFNSNRDGYERRGGNQGGYNNNRGGSSNYGQQNRRPAGGGGIGGGIKRLVKPVKYKENIDPNTPIRLNKYLANAGVCSRREADGYITSGIVKVNDEVVTELGVKVKRGDLVTFRDQPVRLESKVYVLLNKPKNCVTTSDDPENRLTVMDLVKNACPERIYPVGRLDRNTTGVLLLTNDGDLASKLTHPKFMKKKIYQVTLDKDVTIEDMQTIADGVELEDGEIHADSIAYQSEEVLNVIGIEIHSGRNRIVRRIFEKLGYHVVKLDRVYFAGLTKKNVLRGKWRYLSEKEVNMLRMGAFE